MVIHKGEFSEAVDDDVEVMLEVVCDHINGMMMLDSLIEVDGGLQLSSTADEEDTEAISTVVLDSEGSDELGWGKQVRHMRNIEKEMEQWNT